MVGLAVPVFIFFGDVRFHLPVMPLLLVAAAATIVTICTHVGEPDVSDGAGDGAVDGDGGGATPADVRAPVS